MGIPALSLTSNEDSENGGDQGSPAAATSPSNRGSVGPGVGGTAPVANTGFV